MNKKVEKSDFKTEAEKCARDIIDWMIKHGLWIDTAIYVNGKRYGDYDGKDYHYGNTWDCVFVEDNMNPRDYFEFAGDFLSMSFEGPLYEILNYYNDFIQGYDDKMIEEFNQIIGKYGAHFEMGDAWNLTLYKD